MRKFFLAIPFALIAAQASAACTTQEDVQKKLMELATVSQQLAAKDPKSVQDLQQKIMKKGQEMEAKGAQPTDLDAVCKFYDEIITDAKKGL